MAADKKNDIKQVGERHFLEDSGFIIRRAPLTIDRGISVIVYANPGVGKTTLCAGLPPDETLIINCEAGIGPLLGTGHWIMDFHEANKNGDIPETIGLIMKAIRDNSNTIKYVVVDNISLLLIMALVESTSKKSKVQPEKSEYGENAFRAHEWINQLRDLTFLGVNVIMTAWENSVELARNDGVVITTTVPMIGKRTAYTSAGIFDVCAHLEIEPSTQTRWLRVKPSDQCLTKCQFYWVEDQKPADLLQLFKIINNGKEQQNGNT